MSNRNYIKENASYINPSTDNIKISTTYSNTSVPNNNSTFSQSSNITRKNNSKGNVSIVTSTVTRNSFNPKTREEVSYNIKNKRKGDIPTKAFANNNYNNYDIKYQGGQPKKNVSRVNNFAYYDSNNDVYKEKGEEADTMYINKNKRRYRTICRSPKVNVESYNGYKNNRGQTTEYRNTNITTIKK